MSVRNYLIIQNIFSHKLFSVFDSVCISAKCTVSVVPEEECASYPWCCLDTSTLPQIAVPKLGLAGDLSVILSQHETGLQNFLTRLYILISCVPMTYIFQPGTATTGQRFGPGLIGFERRLFTGRQPTNELYSVRCINSSSNSQCNQCGVGQVCWKWWRNRSGKTWQVDCERGEFMLLFTFEYCFNG